MRICLVCSEYPPGPHGGIGTATSILGSALVERGHEVLTLGIYPKDYPAPNSDVSEGVRIHRLRASTVPAGWMLDRYRLYREVKSLADGGMIDLVEMPDWAGWGAFWSRLSVPIVVRLHGSVSYFAIESGSRPDAMTFRLERASLLRSEFTCSVSKYTAEATWKLFRMSRPLPEVLYNSVQIPKAEPDFSTRSQTKVVFTGTLVAKKGIVSLIDSWKQIQRAVPDAELHVYGKDAKDSDGRSMKDVLKERLEELRDPRVEFHGHVARQQVLDALSSARVAVFPSFAEAFAIAPLEAMACGCPTIYSNRGSGPELMNHGEDGLLIDPSNPSNIAQAVVKILTDDTLAIHLGHGGRRRSEEDYSIDRIVLQNEKYYEKCLSNS